MTLRDWWQGIKRENQHSEISNPPVPDPEDVLDELVSETFDPFTWWCVEIFDPEYDPYEEVEAPTLTGPFQDPVYALQTCETALNILNAVATEPEDMFSGRIRPIHMPNSTATP